MDFYEELTSIDLNDIGSCSQRLKYALTGALSLLIIVVAYSWILKPKLTDLVIAKQQEERLKENFLKQKALTINLDAYVAQTTEAENKFADLFKQLPNQTEIPDLLIDITQLGISRGLQFEQIKPTNLTAKDFYVEQILAIKAHGEYFQIAGFISDIAELPRIITVDNFSLTHGVNVPQLILSAELKIYHYLDGRSTEVIAGAK